MEKFQKEYISLIQAAFSDKTIVISDEFDWGKAVTIAKKHNIASIIFYGALNCNISQDSNHMKELYQLTLQSLMVSLRQTCEIERIEETFENERIDYMPLKGAILKSLYPKPEMRTMGDADILIRLEQYSQIEKIMIELGFEFQQETNHELIWKNSSLFLELHKSIMTSYNKDFYAYFGTGWKIANQVSNRSRYEMSAEDFYIYIFVHFTKHYRISGIGIKHLLDLWVYANASKNLNWSYIENELKKLNLYSFYLNVVKTIDAWFDGGKETEVTDLITNVIFNSGQYGSKDMAIINRALQNGKTSSFKIKSDRIFKAIFLPYKIMKEKYRILETIPVLLPVMWCVRCFCVFIYKKENLKNYMRQMNQIDDTNVNENKQALDVVGLYFDCEE